MSTPLELAQTEDLIRELMKRYTALVVLGVHVEDPETVTEVVDGPGFMCAGLVHQAAVQIEADMRRHSEDEEE